MTDGFVPLAIPDLRGNEEEFVRDAIASTWISSTGKYLDRFEAEFARSCGTTEALAVSNGTVALHLALLALGAGPGDEVIVPSLTYVATANAVKYVGATPVFADVDPLSWGLDPVKVESLVGERTVGIIAVHLYGHPADMDPLGAVAKRHGLWLVEDAAEAPFGSYRGRPVGSLADVATFSFYGNKVITSGEGGALATSDGELADRMRLIRGQGMDPARRYFFPITGHNFRLTNIAAAILCAQLERRDEILADRARVVSRYRSALESHPNLEMQPIAAWAHWIPWLFSVLVKRDQSPIDRDELATRLLASGIDTRPFFLPLHTLPPFREYVFDQQDLSVTLDLAARGLNLPTHPGMDDDTVDRVVDAIEDALS